MDRSQLEEPFAPNEIKQRKGRNNKMMEYIEGHTVIQRLNDIFNAEWKFTIISHEIREEFNEVMVLGKLTAPNAIRMQFGSSQLTRAKETGKIIAVGDDLKSAATDSLKKCATQLGIGLHLYRKDEKQGSTEPGADRSLHTIPANNSQGRGGVHNQNVTGIQQHTPRLSQPQHGHISNGIWSIWEQEIEQNFQNELLKNEWCKIQSEFSGYHEFYAYIIDVQASKEKHIADKYCLGVHGMYVRFMRKLKDTYNKANAHGKI